MCGFLFFFRESGGKLISITQATPRFKNLYFSFLLSPLISIVRVCIFYRDQI